MHYNVFSLASEIPYGSLSFPFLAFGLETRSSPEQMEREYNYRIALTEYIILQKLGSYNI